MIQGYLMVQKHLFLRVKLKRNRKKTEIRRKTGRGGGSIKGVEGGRELRTLRTLRGKTSFFSLSLSLS